MVEVVIALALVATLAALVVPALVQILRETKVDLIVADLRIIEGRIYQFINDFDRPPHDLSELGDEPFIDRYGNPYRYLSPADPGWPGQFRKDRFLVPLNSDFDLYSMGPDGESRPPLTATVSRDDIVRANNGAFVGRASEF